jgi:hypothetical protein
MTENYTIITAPMREGKTTNLMNMFKDMQDMGYSFDPLTGAERWFISDKLVYDIHLLPYYQSYCQERGMTKLRGILTAMNLHLTRKGDEYFSKWIRDRLEKEQRMKIKSCKIR